MAIDPKQLEAFAGNGGPPPGEDDGQSPGSGGDGGDDQEGGPGKFGQLLTLLEANAEDIESLAEEFDPDQLTDPGQELDPSDQDALKEGVESLDQPLQDEIAKSLPGITIDEARELANHLESESIVDDADRFAGWLFRVGQLDLAGGEDEDDDDEEEAEPEEDDGDDADSGGDDAGGGAPPGY